MNLYRQFRAVIKRENFISPGDSVLVGVSGGLDSMVLGHLLVSLKKDVDFKLSLVHVNYKMRGAESDAQEKLVHDFAVEYRLPCFVTEADLAKQTDDNFQQMARDFRYHYFTETALQMGSNKVAVAHHLEDQVETILAQWLRGASLRGLSGMKTSREIKKIKLIRPLLSFSKEVLRDFAQEEKIFFIDDSSNASPKYWRNRLRQELLPVIQDLRPRAFQKIVQVGEELGELAHFVENLSNDWLSEFGKKETASFWLPRPRFVALPKTLRLEILRQAFVHCNGDGKNLKRDHLVRCDQLSVGTKLEGFYNLAGGIQFIRSREDLFFSAERLERGPAERAPKG